MDRKHINAAVLKIALEILENDSPTELEWGISWNDAIEKASKQFRAQIKETGVEIDKAEINHELIWAGIQRDRMFR
jgi:hypothetical protein